MGNITKKKEASNLAKSYLFKQSSSTQQKPQQKLKFGFIGQARAGKTSIITRMVLNKIQKNYIPTVGIDYLPLNYQYFEQLIRIQLMDTSGIYQRTVGLYINIFQCCFLILDLTDSEQINHLQQWINLFRKNNKNKTQILIMAGSKADGQRVISYSQAYEYAKRQGLLYFEIDAHSGKGIQNFLQKAVELSMNLIEAATI